MEKFRGIESVISKISGSCKGLIFDANKKKMKKTKSKETKSRKDISPWKDHRMLENLALRRFSEAVRKIYVCFRKLRQA